MAGPKFWTSTVLLAFISLSGAASEPRRCYWCGPLAEQVHRSRRSAACRGADPVAACEPGYDYCAIVTTSPPRVESRYCVKVYQDECYPLYCNSTKTWKMTCPCRGDLCNGPNTEREIEAFALLPKLVAKTHNARIKKRTANPAPHIIKQKTIIDNSNEKLIVNESENPSRKSDMQSDQPNIIEHHEDIHSVTSLDNEQTTAHNQLIEIEIHISDPTVAAGKMNEGKLCTDSTTSTQSEDIKLTETIKQDEIPVMTKATTVENEPSIKNTASNDVVPTQEPIATEATKLIQQDVVVVTGKAQSVPPMKSTEITQKEATKPVPQEDQMQNDAPIVNPTDVQLTTEVVKVDMPTTKNSEKPSEPTAEALQQNGSAAPVTEKPTQITTEATTAITIMIPPDMGKMATTPKSRRKNSAGRMAYSLAVLLSCIIYL